MKNEKLIVLAGPTGVGKTDLSINLAKSINGEIISADSMQVYKYMDIGSAKIKNDEMQGIKHYLIDVCEPNDEFNVSIYVKLAKEAISEIFSKNKVPIIVGGTGLYIRSLIYDQKHCTCGEDKEYRKFLFDLASEKGNEYIHNILKKVDYKSYKNIHFNNVKRVIRALEVYHLTNKPFIDFKSDDVPIFNFDYYVLNFDKERLYKNIDNRVDVMIDNDLIDEVLDLKKKGYTKELQSMQGIGYKEVFEYLDGKVSKEQMIDIIKRNSRNYAKRQLTWFRKEKIKTFIFKDEMTDEEILNYIVDNFNRS